MPAVPLGRSTMARTLTHKYIHHENGGQPMEELFDLENDPWELTNLAASPEYTAILDRLRSAVDEWRASTDCAPLFPIERGRHAGSSVKGG